MPGPAKVSAVTVNWNGRDDTLECLGSLLDGGIPDLEIIVVDNGSKDGSVKAVQERFPQVTIIENDQNLGYAKGANQGINMAMSRGATHVLIINNDAVGSNGFISTLLQASQSHEDVGILGCKIFYYDTDLIWYAGGFFHEWLGYTKHPGMDGKDDGTSKEGPTGFVTGCIMMVPARVFRDIGLLDERFDIYAEDLDLCLRARRKGYGTWYVPSAVAYHKVSKSAGQGGTNLMTPFRCYYFARNMLLAVVKNKRWARLLTCVYGQVFILMPYNFFLTAMQRSRCSFRKYLAGFLKGFKMLVQEY